MDDNDVDPIELEALALKVLEGRVKTGLATTKAIARTGYKPGESRKFRSPLSELKLGTVFMTDPDPTWQVIDPEAFEAHLRAYPGNLEDVAEIDDMPAAVAYLTEHHPGVLAFVSRVSDEARREAMSAAKAGHDIPGVERRKGDGVLTVRPDKQAGDAIAELVAAGRLTWDGRRVLEQKREEAS